MSQKKFLDKIGLQNFLNRIKALIPTKTSELQNDSGFITSEGTYDSALSLESEKAVQNKVVTAAINGKQETLSTAQTNAVNSGITSAKVQGYDSHISDTDIHVTQADKTSWDSKASGTHTHLASEVSGLSTVATSGSYNDLSNKPSIPSKTSDLTNDSGFLTSHNPIDSSLSSTSTNAVQNKVINTELGKKANTTDLATVATSGSYNDLSNKPTIPTVYNKTLTIQQNGTTVKTFTANSNVDVTANIVVPTKTSDLTNDSGYLTAHQSLADYSTKADTIKDLSISGKVITYTKGDDTTGTLTTQDTVYTHPTSAGNKHIPSGGSANQFLKYSASGTAQWATIKTSELNNDSGFLTSHNPVDSALSTTSENAVQNKVVKAELDNKANSADLSTVATTGSYTDLNNIPSNFTPASHTHGSITNDGKLGTASRALITDGNKKIAVSSVTSTELGYLSGVTSAVQDQLDGKAASTHSHAASEVSGLATVATSGSYNDLTNKPTIPTVNNATLTIQKNGTTVKTFTANASSNVTANITVPTKVSELTNDSGFLTSHNPVDSALSDTSTNAVQNKVVKGALDGKSDTGHTHTASEVSGLSTVATSGSYNDLSNKPTIPTVNNATLTIQKNGTTVKTFTANASSNVTANITVPTVVSELTNDSGYLTSASNLDSSKLTGTIDIARLPKGALERLVTVADQTARFALTTSDVQLGDTVKQLDTGVMYIVTDESKLSSADGYTEYTAGAATSVPWSGVTDKPSSYTPASHSHGNIANGGTLGTASKVVITDSNKKITTSSVSDTELGYLSGVTSNVQTQLNAKADDSGVVHKTGNETISGTKTFSNSLNLSSSGTKNFSNTNTSWTMGESTPSSQKTLGGLCFADSANANVSFMDIRYDTNGNVYRRNLVRWRYTNGQPATDGTRIESYTDLGLQAGGIPYIYTNAFWRNDLSPQNTNSWSLGDSNHKWKNIYADNYYLGATAFGDIITHNASDFSASGHTHTASDVSGLATVATSGSYNDLSNKPTIPTVNNATLTIQKNGSTVKTFTANASSNVTANITVPTKTSDLTNDSHQTITVGTDTTSTASPAHSGTFTCIDSVTRDSNGHVTAVNTKTVTLPSDNNTDTLVTQNVSTANENHPVLLTVTKDATANQGAKTSIFASGVKVNPSTNTVTATTFSGALSGNASSATQFSANKDVTLTGDVTGTASSKAGWSVATTLSDSGVTAGTYGPSADVTGNNNATISVPEITVDSKGRVTSVANRTLTCKNNTYNVYNKTLTIQKNGTSVATFTSNSNTDVTANITVPTKTSELTNDSGYLTSHQSLSNYVTLNGDQTISGAKTFTGNVIGINKDSSTENANDLYSTTAGSKLTYYTTTNGGTTLTNVPAAVNTTLESRTIRRLSDSDWIVEQICHNSNGLYYRKGNNGTWGAWKTFAFTDSNISGTAANVTGTVAIANGGTGATSRLNAVKNLTNENVGTGTQYFLTITSNWGKAGYCSVADAKTALGLGSAAYTASTAYAAASHTHTKSQITDFPTKVSAFTNDAGYLTSHQSLANYVTLNSAQTISAVKTISAADLKFSTTATRGTAPSADISKEITTLDSAGNGISKIGAYYYTDKHSETRIYAYKTTVATGGNIGYLGIGCNTSGNVYTFAPTPATSDNSTQIATTAFVYNNAAKHFYEATNIYVAKAATGNGSGSNTSNYMSLADLRTFLATAHTHSSASDLNGAYNLQLLFKAGDSFGNATFDAAKMPGVRNLILNTSTGTNSTVDNYSTNSPTFGNITVTGDISVTMRNLNCTGRISSQYGAFVSIDTYMGIASLQASNYGYLNVAKNMVINVCDAHTDYLFSVTNNGILAMWPGATVTINFRQQCYYTRCLFLASSNGTAWIGYSSFKLTGTEPMAVWGGSGTLTGTSETAAATVEKAVTLASGQTFTLTKNATAKVKFTIDNTAANPTLNIGGTGAKPIYWNNVAVPAAMLMKNITYDVKYNGSQFVIQNAVKRLTNNDFGVFRSTGNYDQTYNSGSWNFTGWNVAYGTGIENSNWRGSHIGNIQQNVTSNNNTFPILFSGTANATANTSTAPYFGTGIKVNPSTSIISASGFSGLPPATTYVAAVADGGALVNSQTTSFGAVWRAPTKNYQVAGATFPNNNDTVYICYSVTNANVTAGTNTVAKQLTWAADTGTLTANAFSGALTGNVTGNCSGSSGSCTGNAATATQFSANKSVTLTGDVTGTASSKAGWSVATTLANSGVTAGTYGPSADVTGNNNATISVPQITVDAKGRVTSVTNRTLTCKNNTYTVNNATLTIQKNGTNVQTFTANQSSNATANITVPTKVSELTNDSGYLTEHQDLSLYPYKVSSYSSYGNGRWPYIDLGDTTTYPNGFNEIVTTGKYQVRFTSSTPNSPYTVTSTANDGILEIEGISSAGSVSSYQRIVQRFYKYSSAHIVYFRAASYHDGQWNWSSSWTVYGDIVTHNASEFLTSHQSLSNYVTLNSEQTITAKKNFSTTVNTASTTTSQRESWGIAFTKTDTNGSGAASIGTVQPANSSDFYTIMRLSNPRSSNKPASGTGINTGNCWSGIGVYYKFNLNRGYPYAASCDRWDDSSNADAELASTSWVRRYCETTKGFLTSHQSLSNYSTLANTVKSLSISGKTITVTPGSGSAYTLTTQDTVYTHPTTSGNKHIPSGGSSGQFLGWASDGTAKWVNNPNTNTDTLMTQNVSTTNATYPVLLVATADATANQGAKTGIFAKSVKVNPSTNVISASGFSGPLTGNVTGNCSGSSGSCTGLAAKATGNANGKELTNSIIKGLSISGKTITYTQIDGSTGTLTTQDTVYTHPTSAGNKHVPSGGSSGQFLGWDSAGTAKWVNNPNTDTLMTQNVSTTNATYPILLCPTADATSNQGAKTGIFAKSVKINPKTNTLYTSNLIYSGSLYQYKSGYTKGGTFSSNVYLGNAYCDTAGTALSDILYFINTTENGGSAAICLRVHGNPNYTGTNTAQEPSLGVGVTKDNAIYTFAPTPATADNSTQIATTAFVKAQGYSKTDTKVTQTVTTTDSEYPILAMTTASATATETNGARFSKGARVGTRYGILISQNTYNSDCYLGSTSGERSAGGIYGRDYNNENLFKMQGIKYSSGRTAVRFDVYNKITSGAYDTAATATNAYWRFNYDITGKYIDTDMACGSNWNPLTTNSKTLGTSSLQWKALYATTVYEGGTALSSKYALNENFGKGTTTWLYINASDFPTGSGSSASIQYNNTVDGTKLYVWYSVCNSDSILDIHPTATKVSTTTGQVWRYLGVTVTAAGLGHTGASPTGILGLFRRES